MATEDNNRQWEADFSRILNKVWSRKESEVFKTPVDWEALGIPDYPDVIKQPMDLGTIMKRLESNSKPYRKPDEAAYDMRLVWNNAMLYNAPGSKIYQMAKNLSDFWETQWSQLMKEDPERPPTADDAIAWVDMCHRLSSEEMGKVLNVIDSICPQCLSKRIDTNEIEINIDIMSGKAFKAAQAFVTQTLPETVTTRRKQKRSSEDDHESGGGGGGRHSSGGGGHGSHDKERHSSSSSSSGVKRSKG